MSKSSTILGQFSVKRIAIDAVLIAMYFGLSLLSVQIGGIKITFASLPTIICAMLYRFAAYRGYDTTARKDLSAFTDASRVLEYALEPMQWACAEGIVSGDGSYLLPQGNATRAQVATILMRFIENIAE